MQQNVQPAEVHMWHGRVQRVQGAVQPVSSREATPAAAFWRAGSVRFLRVSVLRDSFLNFFFMMATLRDISQRLSFSPAEDPGYRQHIVQGVVQTVHTAVQ